MGHIVAEEQYQKEQAANYKAEQSRLKGDWATPQNFAVVVKQRYDLNFDAAADRGNALTHAYISETQDALSISVWARSNKAGSRVWLNPPHRKFLPWFEKAYEQVIAEHRRVDIIVVMALPSFSSKWWRRYAEKADEIIDLSPRVQFVPPEGLDTNNSGNSRERCLIVFRREPRHPVAPARYTWHWKEEKEW